MCSTRAMPLGGQDRSLKGAEREEHVLIVSEIISSDLDESQKLVFL